MRNLEHELNMRLHHEIAALQQTQKEHYDKYTLLMRQNIKLECLVDSSVAVARPTPLVEDMCTPQSITNLLPHYRPMRNLEHEINMRLQHEIAALQQTQREHADKYAELVRQNMKLQCLVDSSIGGTRVEDLCTPESITNLLPHDRQLIFDALVVLEPLPTNRKRKATVSGMAEDFRCQASEGEAVKSNHMADLFDRCTTYTAQQRKLAAIQEDDQQKSLAVLSHYVRVLEQALFATKLRVETQNKLEKYPLAWLDQLTKFWRRSHHSNAGENINAVFAAHFMGYCRLVRAGVVPANDPELHEQALESVGYYEGEPGNCSLPYIPSGILYQVI